jgi:hypothetical protein
MIRILISIISAISILGEIEAKVEGDVVGVYMEGMVNMHNTDREVRGEEDEGCFGIGRGISNWLRIMRIGRSANPSQLI